MLITAAFRLVRGRWLAVVIATLALFHVVRADEGQPHVQNIDRTLRDRMYAEAPVAWERTRDAMRSVDCAGRTVQNAFDKGRLYHREVTDWRIKVDGNRVIIERAEKDLRTAGGPSDDAEFDDRLPPVHVEGYNEHYKFFFKRRSPQSPWVVGSAEVFAATGSGPPARRVEKSYLDGCQVILNDNTELGMVPLAELIRDPGFDLKSLIAVQHAGSSCVKVEFSYVPQQSISEGGSALQAGWFIADPGFHWAVHSFGVDLYSNNVYHIENDIEYVPPRAARDLPMIRAISTRLKTDYGHSGTSRVELEINKRRVGLEEFRLAHYGLPEPISPGEEKKSPTVELTWDSRPLADAEAGKPAKFSVVISNRSATPLVIVGFFDHCGRVGCVDLNPEEVFPIEVAAGEQRTFSAELTPRRAGKFEDLLEFYTDAAGGFSLSAPLVGEAH